MNRFEVIGRLTKDSEIRYTKDNKEVALFTLATSISKDSTSFIKITAFGNTASLIKEYTKKGDKIFVEGAIKNNEYTDKNGNKRFEYIFIAQKVEFLQGKSNYTKKEENSGKGLQNGLEDSAFEEFGKKIEISDSEIAF